jgi:hypothetical protein
MYAAARLAFMRCPSCGEVQDHRYKRLATGNPLQVYRISDTSVTLRCKNCSLQFTATWNAIIKHFKTLRKNSTRDSGVYERIIENIEMEMLSYGGHRASSFVHKWYNSRIHQQDRGV